MNSLPTQPTTFVGRTDELAEIGRLLNDPACRLLTLVGAGGIGILSGGTASALRARAAAACASLGAEAGSTGWASR